MLNLLSEKMFFMDTLVQSTVATQLLPQNAFEYLLVVHPDAASGEQVMAEKQAFYERYRHKTAVKTKPHITVASFLAREEMEPTLIRWIHRITSMQPSFPVTLNNYSGFPPHTIYLRVQDHLPFLQLALQLKAVDQYVKGCGCPAIHFSSRPHMSIARRLPEELYEKAMPEYSRQTFHLSFRAEELVLLRRQHQFDTCRQINVFRLLPQDN
jgi:2'-5' RNA ligase